MTPGKWRKSSRSQPDGGNCVETRLAGMPIEVRGSANWRKSSRSQPNGGNCVETRLAGLPVEIRDSKLGDASPILSVGRAEFRDMLAALSR